MPMQRNRMVLTHELNAIEYWDNDYRLKELPDAADETAFNARQKRREQILQTLEDLLSAYGRTDQKPKSTLHPADRLFGNPNKKYLTAGRGRRAD